MADDQTLAQTGDELSRARERSLEHARPPTQVPGYQAERFLGAGAYGEVWVARDRNTGRRVSIKFYTHRGGLDWSLLAREVEKLAFLFADRYVVQLIDVGWDADPPYYIMEYLEQGSLAERLKAGPLPVAEAIHLFREIAIGLVHAHGKGVLHCDLKPANVLLDQDLHPRLADFGQSRMSNEQRPALGTLFYMAPEQADLKAVPDARWDVYALGAVFYCMLTGQPPYRTDEASSTISGGGDLEDQLQRYVQWLHLAPRAGAHRLVPGVGRDLAEIIDRCLTLNPAKRYANPQAVLDALQARAIRQARRPLLLLGALGPIALLSVLTFFAWNSAETSVRDSERALIERSLESNRFAARFVAETVASQIDRRWYTLEEEANDKDLHELLVAATGKPRTSDDRQRLQSELETMHRTHPELPVASWFLLDDRGNQLARSPFDASTLDRNFAYRDYFHGQGRDLENPASNVPPLREAHRSHVFFSDSAQHLALAFTVPIWGSKPGSTDEQVIGVLGITANFGHFAVLQAPNTEEKDRVAVLVDTLLDGGKPPRRGLILEHGHRGDLVKRGEIPDSENYIDAEEMDRLLKLRTLAAEDLGEEESPLIERYAVQDRYVDPVQPAAGRWLAAFEPVFVDGRPKAVSDTGLVVIVQERFDDAVRPARQLGQHLVKRGLLTAAVVVALVTALWGFVIVVLNEAPRFRIGRELRKRAGLPRPVAVPEARSPSPGSSGQ